MPLSFLVFFLLLAACSQDAVIYKLNIEAVSNGFGSVIVAAIDDIDGDEICDYIAAMPSFEKGNGLVRAISAASGEPIWRVTGRTQDYIGITIGAIGDIDGDNVREFAYSSTNQWLCIVSGLTRKPVNLSQLEIPRTSSDIRSISSCSDLDGDGLPEILLGVRHPEGRHVRVCSGINGRTLHTLRDGFWNMEQDVPWHAWPICVTGIDDIDLDCFEDILVGFAAPSLSYVNGWMLFKGIAAVFSGRTGNMIRAMYSEDSDELFGYSVAALGDIDGDQIGDYAVATSWSIIAYSGLSGEIIHRMPLERRGTALDTGGLLDGDCLVDCLVYCETAGGEPGKPFAIGGAIEFFSGEDGREIGMLELDTCLVQRGSACFVDDINRDGISDILLALPGFEDKKTTITVFSGKGILDHNRLENAASLSR